MDNDLLTTSVDKNTQSNKKNLNLANLQGNDSSVFFHKKTEKIVTAIYLVTNFLAEDNPLRRSLRNSSIELLSLIGSVVFSAHPNPNKARSEIRFHASQIISSLSIAFYSGYISEMNYRILEKELELYVNESTPLFAALKDNINLSEIDLNPPRLQESRDQKNPVVVSKVGHKRQKIANTQSTKVGVVDIRKRDRKEVIISVLQKKSNVTIKDISEVISDCSEKTIQRELISLVKEGVLKRDGERRWSTYSLV